MNDRQIYVLMAKVPDIRAVQIADALNTPLVDVSASLRALVEIGDVVRHSGPGPNSLPTQMYNLSKTFRNSREGAALLASLPTTAAGSTKAAPASAPATGQAPASAPTPAPPAAFPTPAFAQQTDLKPARSKVDMVIDHLNVHMSATDAELRIVMGLAKTVSPKAYLTAALRAERIVKDGDYWKLGNGKPAVKPVASGSQVVTPQPENFKDLPERLIEELSKPAQAKADVTQPNLTPQPEVPPTVAEPAFRCGLWSDGVLELQRNGRQVAMLTRREGEQLVDFMERMLGQAEAKKEQLSGAVA